VGLTDQRAGHRTALRWHGGLSAGGRLLAGGRTRRDAGARAGDRHTQKREREREGGGERWEIGGGRGLSSLYPFKTLRIGKGCTRPPADILALEDALL
jgi:hypothetical protein